MNLAHRWLCRSAYWRKAVETYILPWVLDGLDIGPNVLEVGPGPGVTTDLLRGRVERLTCVEIDRAFADSLSRRMSGHNVTVVRQDATAMSFPDATFDGAVSFTMLHHVPSEALQNRLLAEVARVLRPGGVFAGTDSLYSRSFRLLSSRSMHISRAPQESGFCRCAGRCLETVCVPIPRTEGHDHVSGMRRDFACVVGKPYLTGLWKGCPSSGHNRQGVRSGHIQLQPQ
jgi:SAM-dependent methyltransferase